MVWATCTPDWVASPVPKIEISAPGAIRPGFDASKLAPFTIPLVETWGGGGAELVSENVADFPRFNGVAVTAYVPVCELAVQTAVAWPLLSVSVEYVAAPPGNAQDGPLAGAAKSTRMPFSSVPAGDVTVTCKETGNALPAATDCGVPALAATVDPGSEMTAPKRMARTR
jgi:hypothetical protein